MNKLAYNAAAVSVRQEFAGAHSRFWEKLPATGTWWTGAERVAIASEVRNAPDCDLCTRSKEALSPTAVEGRHQSLGALSESAVEVVHRVVTDPGRLSKTWFHAVTSDGLTDGQYVELISILVSVVTIDSFCRAVGVPLHSLPEPQSGEPSHYRPPGARPEGAWVPMIKPNHATGAEAGLYPGKPAPNVVRALSLVPEAIRTLIDISSVHYLTLDRITNPRAEGRTLSRAQIELVAGRVSALRECFY